MHKSPSVLYSNHSMHALQKLANVELTRCPFKIALWLDKPLLQMVLINHTYFTAMQAALTTSLLSVI